MTDRNGLRNGATTIVITASGSPLASAGQIHLDLDRARTRILTGLNVQDRAHELGGVERACSIVRKLRAGDRKHERMRIWPLHAHITLSELSRTIWGDPSVAARPGACSILPAWAKRGPVADWSKYTSLAPERSVDHITIKTSH